MLTSLRLGVLFLVFGLAGCAVESDGLKGAGGEAGGGGTGGAAGTAGTGGVGGTGGTGGLSCVLDEDCPEPELGDWSDCEFESDCAEEGARFRNLRTYGCVDRLCLATDTPETEPCVRETEGGPCGLVRDCQPLPGQECALPPDAGFCEEAGTIEVECTRFECTAGVCTDYAEGQETQTCQVDKAGTFCGRVDTCECYCEPGCSSPVSCTKELRACMDGACVIESITSFELICP